MNNILTRKEYIQSVNEGKFGDAIRGGVKKIKNFISLFVKKVKGVIRILDENGRILPVVTFESTIDRASKIDAITICTTQDVIDSTKKMGGDTRGCYTTLQIPKNEEVYDYIGENSIEYKNLMGFINENKMSDEIDEINERVSYSKAGPMINPMSINTQGLKKITKDVILKIKNDMGVEPILLWGAPGVGKTSIMQSCLDAFNEGKDLNERLGFVLVDCTKLNPGDVLMPTPPVTDETFRRHAEKSGFRMNLESEEERELFDQAVEGKQRMYRAPLSIIPCYRATESQTVNDELDKLANMGKLSVEDQWTGKTKTYPTGGGGIILLDELLRAPGPVLKELMELVQKKILDDGTYIVGSKWVFMAASNRPIDSQEVIANMEEGPGNAFFQRFPMQYLLEPNIDDWKNYMKQKWGLTDDNEILFDFIFEKKDQNAEYVRWHSLFAHDDYTKKDDHGNGIRNDRLDPRQWTKIWIEIKKQMELNKIDNILDFEDEDLYFIIGSFTNTEFRDEFAAWWETHKDIPKLDEIIKNPTKKMYRSKREKNNMVLIKSIALEYEKMFKGVKYSDEVDEKTANICLWLFLNCRGDESLVEQDFCEQINSVFKNFDKDYTTFRKTFAVIVAAIPERDAVLMLKQECVYDTYRGAFRDMLNIMKKYFPYNIDDEGRINYRETDKRDDNDYIVLKRDKEGNEIPPVHKELLI